MYILQEMMVLLRVITLMPAPHAFANTALARFDETARV